MWRVLRRRWSYVGQKMRQVCRLAFLKNDQATNNQRDRHRKTLRGRNAGLSLSHASLGRETGAIILVSVLFVAFGHVGCFFKNPFHPTFIFNCSAPARLFRFVKESFRGRWGRKTYVNLVWLWFLKKLRIELWQIENLKNVHNLLGFRLFGWEFYRKE